jgi:hypothetical protein
MSVTGVALVGTSAFGWVHKVFHSTAFVIARNLALFFVLVFWLGLAFWVYRDARRRIDDPWLVVTATLLGLVPFVGPVVYLLFRPPETLADVRARDLELHALELRLLRQQQRCPVCRLEVEPSFLVCPVCTTRLKQPCGRCGNPLEPLWQACPYCATPSGATAGTLEPVRSDLDAPLAAELAATGTGKARAGSRGGHVPRSKAR